ncbi:MAG: hypothetical protein U0T73_09805 [Chitinophagales bacterium]
MLSAIFHQPLYVNTAQSTPSVEIPQDFNGLCIVIAPGITEAEREQMNKIIEMALQQQPACCWLLTDNGKIPLGHLKACGCERLLLFGTHSVLPARNIAWKKNRAVVLLGMRILITDPLSVLINNTDAKKAFWAGCRASFL